MSDNFKRNIVFCFQHIFFTRPHQTFRHIEMFHYSATQNKSPNVNLVLMTLKICLMDDLKEQHKLVICYAPLEEQDGTKNNEKSCVLNFKLYKNSKIQMNYNGGHFENVIMKQNGLFPYGLLDCPYTKQLIGQRPNAKRGLKQDLPLPGVEQVETYFFLVKGCLGNKKIMVVNLRSVHNIFKITFLWVQPMPWK